MWITELETLQSFVFINRWFALILKINIGGLRVVTQILRDLTRDKSQFKL